MSLSFVLTRDIILVLDALECSRLDHNIDVTVLVLPSVQVGIGKRLKLLLPLTYSKHWQQGYPFSSLHPLDGFAFHGTYN